MAKELNASHYYFGSVTPPGYLSLAPSPRAWLIRELLSIMLGDVPSSRDPNSLLLRDVLHEVAKGFGSASFTCNAAVQRNVHHLAALAIQHVERALQNLSQEGPRLVGSPWLTLRYCSYSCPLLEVNPGAM